MHSHGADQFTAGMAAIATELDIEAEFPADVLAAADRAATSPKLPELDRTDI